jgi:glycosyltransferase involved in cell wall biosynthesis
VHHAQIEVSDIDKHKPIKVLVYAPYVGHGGVRRFVLRLLDSMIKISSPNEWAFHILSQPVDGQGHDIPWPDGKFTSVSGNELSSNLGAKLCDYLQANQDRFWRKLKCYAYDYDIIWLPQPWWSLRITNELCDFPSHIIPTLHDFAFDHLHWKGLMGERFRDEARNLIAVASRVIFSSDYTSSHAVNVYSLPPHKACTVYLANFLPPSFVSPNEGIAHVVKKYNLPTTYWLAFHAMGHKDPKTLLRALARVKTEALGAGFAPLVFAGLGSEALRLDPSKSTSDLDDLSRLALDLGLVYGKDYYALGFVDDRDIYSLYSASVGAIVASKSEAGLSASVFEAFHSLTPLIHSNIAPFIERLGTDDRYALSFPVGDSDALADCMIMLATNPDAARKRASIAYNAFGSRSWDDVASEYLAIFKSAAADGTSKRHWCPSSDTIQNLRRKERQRIKREQVSISPGIQQPVMQARSDRKSTPGIRGWIVGLIAQGYSYRLRFCQRVQKLFYHLK